MKVNDRNLSSGGSATASRMQKTVRTSTADGSGATVSDDVHLAELVRSLRSLAADSPERQARIEELARSVANGTHQVNAEATASGIIDEALGPK